MSQPSPQPEPPLSEAELVQRCAQGDRDAWGQFVDRFGPLIQALARRMLARRTGRARDADVDEIVGEVFLALVRRDRILLHRYDPQYRVSTYLGVICRTEVLRHLRRGNRLPRELEETGHLPQRAGTLGPSRSLEDRERTEAIETLRVALRELPERDRELLTLKYLEGLDYRSIGEALGLNPESVGQFLHRAKTKLAQRVPHLERWLSETSEHES
ncbi:MAG: sigma-70 family RNA polymerase sigma factor [Planctomycetota bacterium]|nr:sigma-70 family RNA polymerase sigma factor [Planctomycetota bacterium]